MPHWIKADIALLALRVRELDLLPRNYKNCKDNDPGVDRAVRWIKVAVAQHISFVKTYFLFHFWVV